jgi:hypothetical protein
MPIEFFASEGGTRVRQSFISPTIYIDHWALRLFSDDEKLQHKLVDTLMRKQGTLLLSTLSFAEFARDDDRRHTVAAEDFLERLLPNIYLTDFAFDKIHAQEINQPDNVRRFWPSADLSQLKLFAERAPEAPLGFSMRGFIAMARDNYATLEPITNKAVAMIRACMESQRNDTKYVRAARNARPTSKRTRTFIILAELMREFILNPSQKIGNNDVMDMLHAAIPVNCCDFVLLDGAWEDRVSKLNQRIKSSGTTMPIAKCYSRRNNGVSRFLNDLNAFKSERVRGQA